MAGAAGLCALLLAGCSGAPTTEGAPETEETPHGYVEGAEETAEPQSRLVLADTTGGEVRLLDLITEEVTELGDVPGVDGIAGDGRFAYLHSSGDGTTDVIDTGVWTVDHGDHYHYYRTDTGHVGALDGSTAPGVVTDTALTSVTGAEGSSLLLDRAGLEDGSVSSLDLLPEPTTTALPFAGGLVSVDADGTVGVVERDGEPGPTMEERCEDPRGAAVTRRGLVVGCAEGALHVTEVDDALDAETLPYPGSGRVESFQHRPGSAVLAALSTDGDAWVLDLAETAWRTLDLDDAVAVTAVGEGAPVLALDGEGTLHSLDPDSGEQTTQAPLVESLDPQAPPALQVDTARAYVNDAEAGLVHEIDYNDDLRVARVFELDIAPHLMIETGR
ncbi:ABC transporter [Nocardiopsis sp. MG754419]|uniref:ABC transporter n=1 Tax=Nocardiopsis sp. MG754419 TaxID=2259865 RepID=UPI001BA79CC0|nr:ABC transporter [Nocardiopsis sp. MG754419]MBR8744287.1 ABC transporter [Nocardiopsis sp. MG754419]